MYVCVYKTHVCINVHVYVCVYVYKNSEHVCVCVCVFVQIARGELGMYFEEDLALVKLGAPPADAIRSVFDVQVYIYIHTYIHIYIYIHTYIHICIYLRYALLR
jgi:hypothetical protein